MTTCGTCRYIGNAYRGDQDLGGRTHFCGKEKERRADDMRPTGDVAEDFIRNFRTFFDAKAGQAACKYYEERTLLDEGRMLILREMSEAGGKIAYGFFSEGNRLCGRMSDRFVERDEWAARRRAPTDGTRDWMLTGVGKAEVARALDQPTATSGKTPTGKAE